MKKRVLLLLASLLLCGFILLLVTADSSIPGDANGNGFLDSNDLAWIYMFYTRKLTPTDEQLRRCDINGNGRIDSNDYLTLRRTLPGLIGAKDYDLNRAVIVIPSASGGVMRQAAEDLQVALQAKYGVAVPVAEKTDTRVCKPLEFILGKPEGVYTPYDTDAYPENSYVIYALCEGDACRVIMGGRDESATASAVARFIEALPNDSFTVDPEHPVYGGATVGYTDYSDSALSDYNHELYYLNEWGSFRTDRTTNPDMGDPCIVYDDGWYYAYGTRAGNCFNCYRSRNLSQWEQMDDCFVPEEGTWSYRNLWAPEVMKIGDKWYLYYTGNFDYGDSDNCQIGVAVSDHPYGPFVQFTGKNADDVDISLSRTPFFGLEHTTVLDQSVFLDDDGQMYMFFSYDTRTGSESMRAMSHDKNAAEIWGVKMRDAVTWDLSTLKPLVSPGYKTLSDSERTIAWETWSPSFADGFECCEGTYMVKSGGKYYLLYCANSFVDVEYAVGYAVSDSPLGDFTKPDDTYLQNMILGVPGAPGTFVNQMYRGFTTGTGHASVFRNPDGSYMLAYHAHYSRTDWGVGEHGDWRALAVDYLLFREDGSPYTNGPTYSLTATPPTVSGYSNIIDDAVITTDGTDPQYLTDRYTNRAVYTQEEAKESSFTAGTHVITIRFPEKRTVRCVNIFNSYRYIKKTTSIDQIDFGEGRGISDISFRSDYMRPKDTFIFPHAAYTVELEEELETDCITVMISSDTAFCIGEIEIIGR